MEQFARQHIRVACPEMKTMNLFERREMLQRSLNIINTMISLKRCSINFMFLTGPQSEIVKIGKLIRECVLSNGCRFYVQPTLEYLRAPDDRGWFED